MISENRQLGNEVEGRNIDVLLRWMLAAWREVSESLSSSIHHRKGTGDDGPDLVSREGKRFLLVWAERAGLR